ncbi:MAG: multiheme c-type cytochrome [Pirellulaceae bacterium]
MSTRHTSLRRMTRSALPAWRVVSLGLVLLWTSGAVAQEKRPFFPSNQTTPSGKTVPLEHYAKNSDCLRCHGEIGKQWKGSMHAGAIADPVFLALYRMGSEQTNGLTDKLCAGCHSSPAVISGHSAPDDVLKLGEPASEGVSCVVCHSVTGVNLPSPDQTPSNAGFVTDPGGPISAARALRTCALEGRDTVKIELLGKSEFCATCHGVVHPLNGFVIERTYDEWRTSIYAAKGIQCQDCHMQPLDKAIQTAKTLKRVPNPGRVTDTGPPRSHTYTHEFIGANAVVTGLMGNQEHSAMSEKLLQSAASIELSLAETPKKGRTVQLRVKVNNETAGHNLPTSLVEVRQMWLDVQVTDADGQELFRSGAIDENGDIDKDAVMYHGVAVDADGKPTVLPWAMERFVYFHTIPPKGYVLERYAFAVPRGAREPFAAKATLRYRSFPQSVANLLLGDGAPTVPVIDMTSAELKLKLRSKKKKDKE